MRGRFAGILGVLAAVWMAAPLSAQNATLSEIAIDHVGLVVADVDVVAKAYADAFGLPVPAVTEERDIVFPEGFTGDRNAYLRTALLTLNGVSVELVQPMGGASPWREHLDKYGEGMHHIAYRGLADAQARAMRAVEKGGTLVVGGPGAKTFLVDLRSKLGMTISFSELPVHPQPTPPAEITKFADNRVAYTSIIVPDIEASLTLFTEITGGKMPNVVDARISYPEGYTGDWVGYPKLGMVALKGMSVAFTAPAGGKSPWSENVAKYGPAMHHFGIQIKGHPQQIAYWEQRGGTLLIGGGTMGYSWIDLSPTLKTLIEMNGK